MGMEDKYILMEKFMKVNFVRVWLREKENLPILIMNNMKVNLIMIKQMVLEHIFIVMERNMLETGKMTKLMVLVLIIMQTVRFIPVIGKMINKMVKERKLGPMTQNMRVTIMMEWNMVRVLFHLQMVLNMLENLKQMKFMGMVNISSMMEEPMKDIGIKTWCMDKVNVSGQIRNIMMVNISMIKNMDMENLFGSHFF